MPHRHRQTKPRRFQWAFSIAGITIAMLAVIGLADWDEGADDRSSAKGRISAREHEIGSRPPSAVRTTGEAPARRQNSGDERLSRSLAGLAPKGIYAVVDTAQNRLWLKKEHRILYEARVSTGSRTTLIDPAEPGRRWTFETPRGVFTILSKIKSPVWTKPDWAFVEEGKPLPATLNDRVEAGVLGDYTLGFGDGYFIHGTLYTRLLGQNVTHGCIRMADADLEFVYKNLPVGAAVFIY